MKQINLKKKMTFDEKKPFLGDFSVLGVFWAFFDQFELVNTYFRKMSLLNNNCIILSANTNKPRSPGQRLLFSFLTNLFLVIKAKF